jgi:hypothetical protein
MRGSGAAKRQQADEPPGPENVQANLARTLDGLAATLRRVDRREDRLGRLIATTEKAVREPGCPRVEGLLSTLTAQHHAQLVSLVSAGRHVSDAERRMAEYVQVKALGQGLYEMGIADGRRLEREETAAAVREVPRQHRARSHLKLAVPVLAAGSVAATAATATVVMPMFDASNRQQVAVGHHPVSSFTVDPSDSASPIVVHSPRPRPRVTSDAKTATRAVVASPVLRVSPPPAKPSAPVSVPAPSPSPGFLQVQQVNLVLLPGVQPGVLSGTVTLYAISGPVDWQASADGLNLDVTADTIPAGGIEQVHVTAAASSLLQTWTLTFTAGQATQTVQVTAGT